MLSSMGVLVPFVVLVGPVMTNFAISEGAMMSISREVTIYVNQSLSLSCQTRDSPRRLVFWYKSSRSSKGKETHVFTGPSFKITKATIDDTAFYSCSAAEWGFWGIRRYILINVIEPGKPSCANGWSLYKNSCFMHSAKTVTKTWTKSSAYCNDSSGQLAKVSRNSNALRFLSVLAGQGDFVYAWVGSSSGSLSSVTDYKSKCTEFNSRGRTFSTLSPCSKPLPFICERVLPEVPKDVTIEYINFSAVRVGWNVATSGNTVTTHYVELSTASGNVVKRRSSLGRHYVIFSHLLTSTQYRVRVQAENTAGNGSSSSPVSFKMRRDIYNPPLFTQNNQVIAGNSITLRCGEPNQNVQWYKDQSNVALNAHGHELTIQKVSSKDEGTYHCVVDHGPKVPMKVLVIEPPVITEIQGILLEQRDKQMKKRELQLLCNTANSHPLEYAWLKDGEPLAKGNESVKVSLDENTAFGVYECQVSNIAGSASKSLVISSTAQTAIEAIHSDRSKSSSLVAAIAVVSVLLVICCLVGFTRRKIVRLILQKSNSRKLTMQSTSTEMATVEEGSSPGPVSPTENVTRDNEEVFPYDVIPTLTRSNGPYMSLSLQGNSRQRDDGTQVRRPDYTNISPSNRSDSAANCMYAPLILTEGMQGGRKTNHPYVNVDSEEASSDM